MYLEAFFNPMTIFLDADELCYQVQTNKLQKGKCDIFFYLVC